MYKRKLESWPRGMTKRMSGVRERKRWRERKRERERVGRGEREEREREYLETKLEKLLNQYKSVKLTPIGRIIVI